MAPDKTGRSVRHARSHGARDAGGTGSAARVPGCLASAWGESERGRRVKSYTLTKAGRTELRAEEAAWQHATGIVARFFKVRENVS